MNKTLEYGVRQAATPFNYAFFVGREVQAHLTNNTVLMGTVKQYYSGILKLAPEQGREVYININNIVCISLNN